jgi:hypothetical protein
MQYEDGNYNEHKPSAGLKAAAKALADAYNAFSSLYQTEVQAGINARAAAKEAARLAASAKTYPLTQEQADLIGSVLGQLSDGMWENLDYYNVVWQNCNIVDGPALQIDIDKFNQWKSSEKKLIETFSTREGALRYFARKAQAVHNQFFKDHPEIDKNDGTTQHMYLDQGLVQTVADVERVIKTLKV